MEPSVTPGIMISLASLLQVAIMIVVGLLVWYIKVLIQRDRQAHEKELDQIKADLEKKAQAEKVDEIEGRLEKGDIRMKAIETALTDTKEGVNKTIQNTRETIIEAINKLEKTMLTTFVTKEDCRSAQSMMEHKVNI